MKTMNLVVLATLALNFIQPAFAAETATKQPTVITQAPPGALEKNAGVVDNKNLVNGSLTSRCATASCSDTPSYDDWQSIKPPYWSKDGSVGVGENERYLVASFSNSQSGEVLVLDKKNLTITTRTYDVKTGNTAIKGVTSLKESPAAFKADAIKLRSMVSRVIGTSTDPAERAALLKIKTDLNNLIAGTPYVLIKTTP